MGIRKILRLEFNSSALRKILGGIYKEGKYYRILFGKLKGMRSYYQHDINFHAIVGLWENDSFNTLTLLSHQFGLDKKKMVIADVGANIGYYALYFSKYYTPESEIYSFEPSVSILDVLKKNIAANKADNVHVLDLACSDKSGEVEFYVGEHHHQSSMISDWAENETRGTKMVVKSTSLDDFFSGLDSFPDLIKMDIEGGGVFALKGCEKCIRTKKPFILVESHTGAEDLAVSEVMLKYGYDAYRINDKKWVKKKDKNYKDKEGVWGSMLLVPSEVRNKFVI